MGSRHRPQTRSVRSRCFRAAYYRDPEERAMEQEIETLTRTVRIPGSDQHAGHHLITVTVLWECPRCGGPRGAVGRAISYDGSRQLSCDGWTNPADTSTCTAPSGWRPGDERHG